MWSLSVPLKFWIYIASTQFVLRLPFVDTVLSLKNYNTLIVSEERSSIETDLSGRDESSLETLRLVQFIHRHGDRNQVSLNASSIIQYIPPLDSPGQLTQKGKVQMYELGKLLRRRYDGYLDLIYSPSQILVQAGSIDRWIQSANALNSGLFLNQKVDGTRLSFVPVHVISWAIDNTLEGSSISSTLCPRYAELKSKSLQKLTTEIGEGFFDYVSNLFQFPVMDIEELVEKVEDGLIVMISHGLPLPSGVSAELYEKLVSLKAAEEAALVENKEMERLFIGPLFSELVDNMDSAISSRQTIKDDNSMPKSKGTPKAFEYSTNDGVVAGLLLTLKMHNNIPPPYGATIILELHTTPQVPDYNVRFFYMNDTTKPPYELHNPECGRPCSLETLKTKFSFLLDAAKHYKQICQN